MPPRPSHTGSFSITDSGNEVVCPLKNNDGSNCRKRCFGEKRYRSMQEHIRRAHPDYYIPKLPATEESFLAMVNTPLSDRPPQPSFPQPGRSQIPNSYYTQDPSSPVNARPQNDLLRRTSLLPAASAAAALAQLHNSRPPDVDWDDQDPFSHDPDKAHHLHNYFANSDPHNLFSNENMMADPSRQRDFFVPPMTRTPSGRATSLQPSRQRNRKSSVGESARKPKHERQRSKDQKRLSHDRKAASAEPSAVRLPGNRWEDLLDAAASATEEDSRDLTPIPQSPRLSQPPFQQTNNHNAFQSYTASPLQNTVLPQSPDEASPSFEAPPDIQPFPSVEPTFDGSQNHNANQPYHHHHHHHHSSADSTNSNPYTAYQRAHAHHTAQSSGSNFHIPHEGLTSSPQAPRSSYSAHNSQSFPHPPSSSHSISGPQQQHHHHHGLSQHTQASSPPLVQHYCAACHSLTPLSTSYACTECICGLCRACTEIISSYGPERSTKCPRCHVLNGKFKPFLLDLR